MKMIKKPMVMAISLVAVIGMISFVTMSSSSSLGPSSPVSLNKNSVKEQLRQEQLNLQQDHMSAPPPAAPQDDDVVKRPKHGDAADSAAAPDTAEYAAAPDAPDAAAAGFTDTPFMPKMANETLKAQLGNASWRLFHTILARYPDAPSAQEQATLTQYITLFAQVYPCGDCARHFQKLLAKFPPQTKLRKNAALWGCDIHNKVNERLEKPQYDCTTILEDYDCGCGSDEQAEDATLGDSISHLRQIEVSSEQKQTG